jgi:hypothetical protein
VSGFLAIGVLLFPSAARADPGKGAAPITVADAYQADDPVVLAVWDSKVNGNWQSRCKKGRYQSYITTDYNPGTGAGRYDIQVRLAYAGEGADGEWEDVFPGNEVWASGRLAGPDGPGRGGYFKFDTTDQRSPALGNNGRIGIQVFKKNTIQRVWSGYWDVVLDCGNDYTAVFKDAANVTDPSLTDPTPVDCDGFWLVPPEGCQ